MPSIQAWYKSVVIKGSGEGSVIGFPTINLLPAILPPRIKEGVYAAHVRYAGKNYGATLYFGPRRIKNESHNVLEIYIHDFSKQIYGEEIEFVLGGFIRPVLDFDSYEALKKQIQVDVDKSKQFVYNKDDPPK